MPNIFDSTTSSDIFRRMEKLQPDSKALWGKMTVAQMLAHLMATFEIAMSEKKINRTFFGLLFGKMAKKKMMHEKPIDKNLPTDPSLVRNGEYNFEEERFKLSMAMHHLLSSGEAGLSKFPHPFFGKLTNEEWGVGLWKHIDHHFNQFGV